MHTRNNQNRQISSTSIGQESRFLPLYATKLHMVGKTNNALQRHFSQKPNAPSITVGTGRPGNLSDRVGGGIIIRHAHVVIDSGTETGETSAAESGGLRTGFGSKSAACDAASCHTIV